MLSSLDVNTTIDPSDIDLSWNCWKDSFLDVMQTCIPTASLPTRHNLPWLSKALIQLMRKRNQLFRQARSTNDPKILEKYHSARDKLVSKLREAKSDYFNSLNPGNCKEFWKAVKYIN